MKIASINLKRLSFLLLAALSLVLVSGPKTFANYNQHDDDDDEDKPRVSVCEWKKHDNKYTWRFEEHGKLEGNSFLYEGPTGHNVKESEKDAWCLDQRTVTPTAVTFVAPTCTVKGTYTVPTMAGVTYYLGEAVVAAGTYTVSTDSTVKVAAKLSEGYFLDKDAVTEWSKAFVTPTCPVVTTPGTVAGASTTAQVAVKPVGSANAGGAGTLALVGLGASTVVLAFGVLVRKFSL